MWRVVSQSGPVSCRDDDQNERAPLRAPQSATTPTQTNGPNALYVRLPGFLSRLLGVWIEREGEVRPWFAVDPGQGDRVVSLGQFHAVVG
jgi:hypothetical protein